MVLIFHCLPFRELSLEQLYDLLQLRQEVFVVEQFCPYLDADDKDQSALHLLGYTASGKLVAYVRILPPGISYATYASIGRVVTSPSARGHRLGYKLMETALAQLAEHYPGQACKISAQAHLQNFYSRLGFEQVRGGYLEDGIPHIPMVRMAQDQ